MKLRMFYITITLLLITLEVNSQTIMSSNGDSIKTNNNIVTNNIWPKIFTLKKSLKIQIDSNKYMANIYRDCYSIEIQDTSRYPNTGIIIDENGNIVSFWQNFQNRIWFDYDKTTGKLLRLTFENNNGKRQSVKIK